MLSWAAKLSLPVERFKKHMGFSAHHSIMSKRSNTDLLSLPPEDLTQALEKHFRQRDQPTYRIDQVRRWLYEGLSGSIDEMTDLPMSERDALKDSFILTELEEARVEVSQDGTVKHLWCLSDGEFIESVLIPTRKRLTLCISSQAGCAMGCTFCATGWGGFQRQLTTGEIVSQYSASRRWAEHHLGTTISNIVYMGMGEPLSNRKAVHDSLSILNQGYAVGARRITVSTVGVVPGILELAERPEQFRLALSLHAPISELRLSLIPLEKRHPLPEVLSALKRFNQSGGKRITFEYTMIRGVNDALELIAPLVELARSVEAYVNLIPFNPIPYQNWEPSELHRIKNFANNLNKHGVPAAIRETRGRDIDAACGQLKAHALVQLEKPRQS